MADAVLVSGLVRTFGPVRALNGLDLTVRGGEILGLLGPNGSGKTTLIRVIAGLLRPTAGSVVVLERRLPDRRVAARIGYMTQSAALYEDLTPRENLIFFGRLYGLTRADATRRAAALVDRVALSEKADAPVHQLSGGMRQRTNLACALIHQPDLLLLDEPTVGIDPRNRRSLWDHFYELHQGGATILLSTHIMDEVERCHRVAMIEQGQIIAAGTPEELRRGVGAATIEEAYLAFSGGAVGSGGTVPSAAGGPVR
ncbi:MAG: ABC transporter ATP-binding protein [Armatimonadetes bacterium]|nr:ABC transporter ATP-binding protein [Armatimonadota bacterium]